MSEHVTDCLHPRFVYNRYINKMVYVDCQKCPACLQKRRSQWVARMIKESQCWQFAYVLYLDYNDEQLPRYDFDPNDATQLIEACPRLSKDIEPVKLVELQYENENEQDYVVSRLNAHKLGLPHPCVRDIQLFKKRLNTIIKRKLTGRYQNFRSCIAAEVGETTFRPHYHGILFFDGVELASKISEFVDKAWRDSDGCSLGHAHADPPKGNAFGYISKYISKPANLPALYSHSAFRPFFLTSRNPPIGSLFQSTTEIREIFDSCSPVRVVFGSKSESYSPKVVPLEKRYKDRLFPKCPLFSQIPPHLRSQLYGIILDDSIYDFESYVCRVYLRTYDVAFDENLQSLKDIILTGRSNYPPLRTQFSDLIVKMTDNFDCLHSLQDLYCMSKRILLQSQIFGVSFYEYLQHIYRFYDFEFPQYQLKLFYRKQDYLLDRYHEDYRVFYPETEVSKGISPTDSKEYQLYRLDVMSQENLDSRTKQKNDYLESKLVRKDPVLYNLIKSYYAKKCDETY